MRRETAWVKSAPTISGQDHLGTIAPAEAIYTTLLPGITNVTARARYYTFFPWFLREMERRGLGGTPEEVVGLLRRAECLFALAAIRHARVLDEDEASHGATMVGREKLRPAIDDVDSEVGHVMLAEHADLESDRRYFQNPLGGLGQYYFGPLREVGILGGDTRTRDLRYTDERGRPLAEAFAERVDANQFFELLSSDVVDVAALDGLASFCPCHLRGDSKERELLTELLLDPAGKLGEESEGRRATLALVLDLVERCGRSEPSEFEFAWEFRATAYASSLATGEPWSMPEKLHATARTWALYGRHELLSIAFQGIFWAALTSCDEANRLSFRDAPELAAFALTRMQASLPPATWDESFRRFAGQVDLPALPDWTNDEHEIAQSLIIVGRGSSPDAVMQAALRVLVALFVRHAHATDPYEAHTFEAGYFDRYPINLRAFAQRLAGAPGDRSVREVVRTWIVWALRTHWRVALQKLAQAASRDTFKVRPLEGSLRVIEAPSPTFSSPRIHRVVGILRDLDVVGEDDGRMVLTERGARLREVLLG